jgi:hypothetical protein
MAMPWADVRENIDVTLGAASHGDAVGYSDAAPYGAGRVFTNANLLTPEGSHIIAHGCAVGLLV